MSFDSCGGELPLSLDQLRDQWNAQADDFNQWDSLGLNDDFRALCAELVEAIFEDNRFWEENLMEIGNRARAALARWGRQVPMESKFNIKWALDALERLRDASMRYRLGVFGQEELQLYEDRAQKVIEAWSRGDEHEMSGSDATPQPVPGDVQDLAGLIRQIALAWEPDARLLGNMTAGQLARAAELLAQRYPQPVPVSERPWEREGWCDEQGQCWWFNPGQPAMSNPHIATSSWRLCRMLNGKPMGAYSLPTHALPLPGEVE